MKLKNAIYKCLCFVSLTLFRYKRNCIFMSFLALLNLFSRKRAWLSILSASFDFIPLINSKTGFFLRLYCLNLCGIETWCRNYLWIWSTGQFSPHNSIDPWCFRKSSCAYKFAEDQLFEIWDTLIFIRESRSEISGEVIIFCRQNNSDNRSV